MTSRITLIYDGIDNAVFVSQVLTPAQQWKKVHPDTEMVLISFERKIPSRSHAIFHQWPGPVHIVKKYRFYGRISLWVVLSQLTRIIRTYTSYTLHARGPHAGWLARAAVTKACASIVIQARGLLAQEYLYTNTNHWVHRIRSQWYERLEHATYKQQPSSIPVTIEAVSPALAQYLIQRWHADPTTISIAQLDKPTSLTVEERANSKKNVRTKLNIPENATVYCYSGSAKAWQCPDQVIARFAQKITAEPQAILLILSQDTAVFEAELQKQAIPAERVRILSVAPQDVITHCAAADIGMVFRESSPVNWVSRPTKALEYLAAGLTIEHNNTVAWLVDQSGESSSGS
jgi:hypothetical protein